jgi:hypothetical protein
VNYFDSLAIAFAALSFFELYRLRPCGLFFAGNNLLLCRSLSAIFSYGRPASSWYVPAHVFSRENQGTAAAILTIIFVLQVAATAILRRPPAARMGHDAPAVPRALLVLLVLFEVAVAGSSATIMSASYTQRRTYYDIELGGLHTLFTSLIIYELVRRRFLGLISAAKSFMLVFAIIAVTGYAKGNTGLPTGFLLTAAVLLLPRIGSERRLVNLARVVAVVIAIVLASATVRAVRVGLASDGLGAVSGFWGGIVELDARRADEGAGVEQVANATQTASHMLECITLYDTGIPRGWRSIYDVVEYTFTPSFFMNWFGWTRSIEPAWELGQYFIHGGGINVLGELYWNGGFLCVVVVGAALAILCGLADQRYRSSPYWLMMVCQFAPSFLMGYGYGFPQVARGAINGLLVILAYKVYAVLSPKPSPPIEPPCRTQVESAPPVPS